MAITRAGNYPDYSSSAPSKLTEQLYARKLRNYYYKFDVIPFICNKDADNQSDIKQMGDKVIFRNFPDVTIFDYSKGQEINYQNATVTTVELTIDKAKAFALTLDDIDKYQADMNYLDLFAQHAAKYLKTQICDGFLADIYDDGDSANYGTAAGYVSANINLGTSGSPRVLTKDNILYWFNDLQQVLDEQNVPPNDRHITLSPAIVNMINSSDLKSSMFSGAGKSNLLTGSAIGAIAGFEIHTTNSVYSSTDGNYKAFDVVFNQKDAIAFCMQITDTKFIDTMEKTFGKAVRGLSVYGYKCLSPKALGWSHVAIQS